MSRRPDRARDVEVSVAEIAELTARLRRLSDAGARADPDERAAFLADKQALLDRIAAEQADDNEARRAELLRADDPTEITARLTDLRAQVGDEVEQQRLDQLAQWHTDDHHPDRAADDHVAGWER